MLDQNSSQESAGAAGPDIDDAMPVDPSDGTSVNVAGSEVMGDGPNYDIGSDPTAAISYPTPVSNPSYTLKLANKILKHRRIASPRECTGRRVKKRSELTQRQKSNVGAGGQIITDRGQSWLNRVEYRLW
jgi:hypothetical protein